MDQLTEDQQALVAAAMFYGPFPCKPEYLADCHRLYERGWFDRQLTDDYIVWRLSVRAITALELGGAIDDATAAMN